MRFARQTELEEIYPTHVVCAWLGNSPTVARGHYLQVRYQHFTMAVGGGAPQKATLHAAERSRTEPQPQLNKVS